AQIMHLKDHGTLPERSYEALNGNYEEDESETESDEVNPDVTGAPNDPSSSDLPEEGSSTDSQGPIREDRK
ncbi:cell division protein FtsH, partial [Bacillus sp. SIMBA_161]